MARGVASMAEDTVMEIRLKLKIKGSAVELTLDEARKLAKLLTDYVEGREPIGGVNAESD